MIDVVFIDQRTVSLTARVLQDIPELSIGFTTIDAFVFSFAAEYLDLEEDARRVRGECESAGSSEG